MLNTTAFLTALHEAGVLPDGLELIAKMNSLRMTPMRPTDEPGPHQEDSFDLDQKEFKRC